MEILGLLNHKAPKPRIIITKVTMGPRIGSAVKATIIRAPISKAQKGLTVAPTCVIINSYGF